MSYTPKEGSKTSNILKFIQDSGGATTEEIAEEFRIPIRDVYPTLVLPINGGMLKSVKVKCSDSSHTQNRYTIVGQKVHLPKNVFDVKIDSLKAYAKRNRRV